MEDSGQPAELLLTPGTPLELRCDARGTPSPNITWHKDGQALSNQDNSRGAGRLLRVEALQVLCPARCEGGQGRASSTWQGLAAPLLCVGYGWGDGPPGPCMPLGTPSQVRAKADADTRELPHRARGGLGQSGRTSWGRRALPYF